MNRRRVNSSISEFKSLSPRPESHASTVKFAKLPHITSTQRLSHKYFLAASDSLSTYFPSESKRKVTVLDVPFQTEEDASSPHQFKTELQVLDIRKSNYQSVLESSSPRNTDEVSSLQNEITIHKAQLKSSAKRINILEKTLKDIGKSLVTIPEENENQPRLSINGDILDLDINCEDYLKIIENVSNLKKELENTKEELLKKEHSEKEIIKEKNDIYNVLTQENTKIKDSFQSLTTKNCKLKLSKTKLQEELFEVKKKHQEEFLRSEQSLQTLTEKLHMQNTEIQTQKEAINRVEHQKKRLNNDLDALETENTRIRNEYIKTEVQLENLKIKYQNIMDTFTEVQSKAKKHDEIVEEIDQKNKLIELLTTAISSHDITVEKLQKQIEQLKQSLESQRQQFIQKEKVYEKTIKELTEQINSEKISKQVKTAEAIKLKKQLTLRENDDTLINVSKEEILRYKTRLVEAETKTAHMAIELDRMAKTESYYKDTIRSKNEIILQLETRFENTEFAMKNEKNDIAEKDKMLQEAVESLRKCFLCHKCKLNIGCKVLIPCTHLACDVCMPNNDICVICQERILFSSAGGFLNLLNSLCNRLDRII
ncbi:hypothetical protein SteCoe_10237 [Stentor coeruleus]|uniref:RING-type domain-containing protein n=1 Tax=Stentor coeruleus TaxID=5963 RepID=A0A1R2CG51_9CILI|nr:hypothetical protein SteCoe_10237 [Stentor coeruleus]